MSDTNEIQGSVILREFRVAGTNDPFRFLVCAQGGGLDKSVETTTEATQCGPIVGIGDVTWSETGDAVVNTFPDATLQISYKLFNYWMVNKIKLEMRLMSPANAALGLDEGDAFFEQGEGYITAINITMDIGSVVKFSWTFSGVGKLNTFGFSEDPSGGAVAEGFDIVLTNAPAGGTAPITYQWQKSTNSGTTWADISGATSDIYEKENSVTGDAGWYRVVATDANGNTATSSHAVVSIFRFITNPSNATLAVGATLTLTGAVTGGTTPYVYQWYKGGVAISGATAATYSKPNVQVGDAGSYTLKATDKGGIENGGIEITSNAATVTVS